MELLAAAEGFEWDAGNLEKNWGKHRASRLECEEAFFNRPLVVEADRLHLHSLVENRYYALGQTSLARHLFIVFTVRDKKIRVISARDMNRRERQVFHEKIKTDPGL